MIACLSNDCRVALLLAVTVFNCHCEECNDEAIVGLNPQSHYDCLSQQRLPRCFAPRSDNFPACDCFAALAMTVFNCHCLCDGRSGVGLFDDDDDAAGVGFFAGGIGDDGAGGQAQRFKRSGGGDYIITGDEEA